MSSVQHGLIAAFLISLSSSVLAHPKHCNHQQAKQALVEADQLQNWNDVHRSFLRLGDCDDGAVGEGYSESVVRLLPHQWSTLPELWRLASSDKAFEEFVLRDVDACLR